MKKLIKISILSIFTILMIGGFAKSAFAVAQIATIQFENTPLFGMNGTGELNFAPGNSVSRWVKITNSTNVNHRAIVRAINVNNESKFGDAVTLQIKKGNTILYNNTFSNFFNKSEVILPQVKSGETDTINFIATFKPESGNNYQNKNMNFSFQIGLEEVESSTDTSTVIGGSGGVVLGQKNLIISNENANFIQGEIQSVIVSWNTNIPATSQVIYGLTSGGPYNLDLGAPNFGYPFSTIETDLDNNKTTNHIIEINNLPAGEYSYRVVSRASPATVSYEHMFIVPLLAVITPVININPQEGDVLGASTEKSLGDIEEGVGSVLGASTGSSIDTVNSVWFWFAIILLLPLIIFFIIYRRRKKKSN